MRFGVHVSMGSGWDKALEQAQELGCETMQVFAKNPRGWSGKALDMAAVERFKEARSKTDVKPLVVHISYLVNLASGKPEVRDKSKAGFFDELERATALGADYLVLHPGSPAGQSRDDGIVQLADTLREGIERVGPGVTVLLENVASESELGGTFEELAKIIELSAVSSRLGICLDTCHAFAYGYELRTPEGLDTILRWFQTQLGLDKLKLLHLNDCKGDRGAHLDRHDHIGMGYLGDDAFKLIINHPQLTALPAILETPQDKPDDDQQNLGRVKSWDESR